MRNKLLFLFLSCFVNGQTIEKAVFGDFNGDNRKEYAWVVQPPMEFNEEEIITLPNLYGFFLIVFSDPSISPIRVESFAGRVDNLGDLNGDGRDEIGVTRWGEQGCWQTYSTYFMSKGNFWRKLIPDFKTNCDMDEQIAHKRVLRFAPGKVTIFYDEFTSNGPRLIRKVVDITN